MCIRDRAEAISPGLARDGEKYTEAINQLVADEPDVLDEVSAEAAAMVNAGALKGGDEVEVVEGGAMQRAQVRRVVDQAEGTYELSLWSDVFRAGHKYEAGFDTSESKLATLPRRSIYANTKQKQALRPWLDPNPNPNPKPNPDPNPHPMLTSTLTRRSPRRRTPSRRTGQPPRPRAPAVRRPRARRRRPPLPRTWRCSTRTPSARCPCCTT